jgi:hypothetical protein
VACAGEDAVHVLRGDGAGGFQRIAVLPAGSNPHGLTTADVDGDGHADLVASARSSGELWIFKGDGKGGFAPRPPIRAEQDVIALGSADFDRDGRVDLALVSASYHAVVMLRGDGTGGFTPFGGGSGVRP